MKKTYFTSTKLSTKSFFVSACIFLNVSANASEEFYGTVENRPTENLGIWTISGQQVEVTDKTDIENDNGPLVVGSCVEVEHNKGVVEEIESAKPADCGKK